MLTKPNAGWTDITLDGEQRYRASYVTDVPLDLLSTLIKSIENDSIEKCYLDAEGWDYFLIVSPTGSMIDIDEEYYEYDNPYDPVPRGMESDKTAKDLAKEIIEDIEESLDMWVQWDPCYEDFSDREREKYESDLRGKIETLKGLIQ